MCSLYAQVSYRYPHQHAEYVFEPYVVSEQLVYIWLYIV